MGLGRRTSPLISYNSIGWNRRNYEPVPDVVRVTPHRSSIDGHAVVTSMHSTQEALSPGRPASRTLSRDDEPMSPLRALSPNERELAYLEGAWLLRCTSDLHWSDVSDCL